MQRLRRCERLRSLHVTWKGDVGLASLAAAISPPELTDAINAATG
jgi:hypothetical protein